MGDDQLALVRPGNLGDQAASVGDLNLKLGAPH
jgi:hypothetical protein